MVLHFNRWVKSVSVFVLLSCSVMGHVDAAERDDCPLLATPNVPISDSDKEHRLRCGINWEPVAAADPNPGSPFAYLVTTTFDKQLCGDVRRDICKSNAIVMRTSASRGVMWGEGSVPCDAQCVQKVLDRFPVLHHYFPKWSASRETKKKYDLFEYDPSIAICKNGKGTVFLSYLLGFIPGVMVQRSDDHGKSWSDAIPVGVSDRLLQTGGTDKPTIVVSEDCRNVYVTFSGEDANYVASSHDGGRHFSEPVQTSPVVSPNDEYHTWFSPNGAVDASGNVYFAEMLNNENNSDDVTLAIVSSMNRGVTWETHYLGKAFYAQQCEPSKHCSVGYLTPQISIASSVPHRAAIAFTQGSARGTPKKLYFSPDWQQKDALKKAVLLNDKGDSSFPMISAGAHRCEYVVTWMDNRDAPVQSPYSVEPFNMYLKKTRDCGITWSDEILLSNVHERGIAKYKNEQGYALPFGDYTGLAVNGFDDIFAIWGEGQTIDDEGDSWFRVLSTGAQ